MAEPRSCERCITGTEICFSKEAKRIAQATKISDDPKKQLMNAFETHKKIAENRITARIKLCSPVNDDEKMNPDYPGRNLL
ncbi:MAG: hypothetical protein WCT51_03390 [Candidatus Shapirobacteria bacterium]|jgi:hypothetical protein